MQLLKPDFEFLAHLEYGSMLHNVCVAVADCYGIKPPSTQPEREQFVRRRLSDKHESVIEHVSFSVRFSVDRGITHELVRHRLISVTQESTRYCKYDLPKFGSELALIMPSFVSEVLEPGHYFAQPLPPEAEVPAILYKFDEQEMAEPTESFPIEDEAVATWLLLQQASEQAYLKVVKLQEDGKMLLQPQIARGMLTNALRAHITITANVREWRHIFKLRALGVTGAPHPQMVEIMVPLLEEAKRRFPVFFEDL